jgi:AbrB family looped-hinge helix DNA binding protein
MTLKCDMSIDEIFFGTATVGERGQIVIPAEARKRLNINPGDKLLVMSHPTATGVLLCKIDAMREFFRSFLTDLERLEKKVAQSESQPSDEE